MSVVFSNHFLHESPYFPDINFDIHKQSNLMHHLDYRKDVMFIRSQEWERETWDFPMAMEISPPKQKAGALSKLQRDSRDSRAQPTTLTCGVLTAAEMNKLSNLSWKTSCKTNLAINLEELHL